MFKDYNTEIMKKLSIKTDSRTHFKDITSQIQQIVADMQVTSGVATIYVPHTTAGITINEHADPDVVADMTDILDRIIPWNGPYRHAEGNTAAHVKTSMMGPSVQVLVENGRLMLGTWQGIFLCEFDGPRKREVWISVNTK